ncbi:MAG: radical SAM family heme chaperone HemW [Cyanobacteria bacterium P01_E01_bin.6]
MTSNLDLVQADRHQPISHHYVDHGQVDHGQVDHGQVDHGMNVRAPTAAYVHIPFCRRRCYYCDFPISVVGDRPPLPRTDGDTTGHGSSAIAQYIEVLCQEIAVAPPASAPLDTVFFGGGTPSLLSVKQLGQVLTRLRQTLAIAPTAECSMEMDPGTFTQEQIDGYVALGINRVSLGVQAFQANLLALCGRTHTPDDIERAIAMLHQAGVTNYSIDLISGLPTQTIAHWQTSLEQAIALSPPHISVYDLTIESGTAFGRWYEPGTDPLPSDTTTATMYRLTQQRLANAGYEHYEISNYAKPGHHCRHNRVYWKNRPYYGFGMGATSYVLGQRVSRPRTRADYAQWVDALVAQGGIIHHPDTTAQDALLDTLMLGMRLAEGIDLDVLRHQFGDRPVDVLIECLAPHVQKGWVAMSSEEGVGNAIGNSLDTEKLPQRARFTDPEGFLFSNVVLSDIFLP